MSILRVRNFHGHFRCKSSFAVFLSICNSFSYEFNYGAYILQGEIDSGGWAFCFALCPVYDKNHYAILFEGSELHYMNEQVDLTYLRLKSCYLDDLKERDYDNTSGKTVKEIIETNIRQNGLDTTTEEIRELFKICDVRFERKIECVGNWTFTCKAAMGYTTNKMIYVFPWLSKNMVEYYKVHIEHVIEVLTSLNKIVLLPTSYDFTSKGEYNIIEMDDRPFWL